MTNPTRNVRFRKFRRAAVVACLVAFAGLGLAVAVRRASGNLGTIEPDRVYRSAQLTPAQLINVVGRHHIKTILNLRGSNPDQSWFNQEVSTAMDCGVNHVSIPVASDQWLSHEQVETLLQVLDNAEYPMLVHCEFGAERTGLVSAIIALLRPKSTLQDGYSQFTAAHMFLPIKDGLVMLGHIQKYESWLKASGKIHEPAQFCQWLKEIYTPEKPSREYWPCSPYPRKVVWSPGGPDGPDRSEELSSNPCPKAEGNRPSR